MAIFFWLVLTGVWGSGPPGSTTAHTRYEFPNPHRCCFWQPVSHCKKESIKKGNNDRVKYFTSMIGSWVDASNIRWIPRALHIWLLSSRLQKMHANNTCLDISVFRNCSDKIWTQLLSSSARRIIFSDRTRYCRSHLFLNPQFINIKYGIGAHLAVTGKLCKGRVTDCYRGSSWLNISKERLAGSNLTQLHSCCSRPFEQYPFNCLPKTWILKHFTKYKHELFLCAKV